MPSTYEFVKKARNKKRIELQALKDNKYCAKCGNKYRHYLLDWHHKDRNQKEFSISIAVRNNLSWDRIYRELDKCILLCKNCHAEVEWEFHNSPVV